MEDKHRRDIALFRCSLIREAADAELTKRERGRLVRRLAAREHQRPDGRRVRVGRSRIQDLRCRQRHTGLHLVGRRVELAVDPFDLTGIELRWAGRSVGTA